MISLEEAWTRLESSVTPLDYETVGLDEALGCVLAEPVLADRDFPPTDRSAMDGFAVRSADTTQPGARLKIVGDQPAGRPARQALQPGEAMRIYTGAVVPPGADAVVMIERTETQPSADGGSQEVRIEIAARPWDHIRKQASELKQDEAVLNEGARIGPPEMAALSSVGKTRVLVHRRPLACVLSTGDEVIEADEDPAPHQVRNSNAPMLQALLRGYGYPTEYLGVAGDSRESLNHSISDGVRSDILLLTGGVSVGAYDLVAQALEDVRAEILFHKVSVKPGKPVLVARADDCWIFGLPGNPISAFAGFHLFVGPAARRLEGESAWRPAHVPVQLSEPIRCRPGRTTYHLARVEEHDGVRQGKRIQAAGSGDVLALARANAFLVTGPEMDSVDPGTVVSGLIFR